MEKYYFNLKYYGDRIRRYNFYNVFLWNIYNIFKRKLYYLSIWGISMKGL